MHIPRFVRYSILALAMLVIPASSFAGVFVSVRIGPPPLPVYVQPPCPGDGYIWTPGYWAYGPDGYYWVPGTWVVAPEPGLLWTPGYWGWNEGLYVWHAGYWGPHVGFYGGINYGFGYFGAGYAGGYWHDRRFYYNRSVNNVTITNVHVYDRTVVNNVTVNRVSYNGGHGGINMRPTHEQERWDHEPHFQPTHMQMDHENGARGNREFLASVNHGRPTIAATARPADFHGRDAVPARGPNRPMGHDTPRPDNGRSMERQAPRQEARGNGGPRPNTAPRPMENRGGPASRPAGRQENNAPRGNMQPHGNPQGHGNAAPREVPRGNPGPHSNEGHGGNGHGGNEGHGRH